MKKALILLVFVFFNLSVQAGWGPDLCEDVTCSGHGYCEEDGSDEWCVCDSGYIADGLNCVLGCDGETCSGHGTCSVAGGVEVCTCEPGFHSVGLQCILDEASTVDTLAIINEVDCYNTGNCHYRFIFATNYYNFTPENASLYDIIINVKDPENNWHNYWKTVAQCLSESVCDNLDAQYVDFWWQHEIGGNQYIAVEITGNGDDAYDHLYHDVIVDPCYGVQCGPTGTCDNSTGYPVCHCGYGYVARDNYCEEGWFEDENLAAAVVDILQRRGREVEDELDIDPTYMFDDINYLYLRGLNISSLVGIHLFPNLVALDVSDNNIDDIWPLGQKESLIELNLSENPVTDGEILSTLINLESLNITNTRIYDFTPVKDIASLQRIFISNENYDSKAIIRPENLSMEAWFLQEGLDGCFWISVPEFIGGKYSKPVINEGCSNGGTCINGRCVCDEGYVEYKGDCIQDSQPCSVLTHWNGVGCVLNYAEVRCNFSKLQKLHGEPVSYVWNGSNYVIPAGKNVTPCHYSDSTCNEESLCLYECAYGFTYLGDGKCEAGAYRDISWSSGNVLREPAISRNDVALEPIPGVPSFVPTLNYREDYLSKGWYLNLPRVELRTKNYSPIYIIEGWDKKVYVNMPWGSEEYSVIVEDICVDSNNNVATCTAGNFYLYKMFPSPGQNVFSHIEMKVKVGSFENGIETYPEDWKVTRYGDDGSVTKFERTMPKPSDFIVMDYIPITEYTTRDGKKVTFEYVWDSWHGVYMTGYKHHIVNEVLITDPMDRAIRVSATGMATGLFGRPDKTTFMTPLETEVNIYTGVLESGQIVSSKRVVRYTEIDGFDMQAYIYKDDDEYRMDEYKLSVEGEDIGERQLTSYDDQSQIIGMVVWESTEDGHIEYRKVSSSPEKWIKKDLKGPSYVSPDSFNIGINVLGYPATYRFFNSGMDNGYEVASTYYKIEGSRTSGTETMVRKITETINDWFHLTKREVCSSVDSEGECTADSAIEKFGYNVNGSPVYFESIDGQVSMDIYNKYDQVTGSNYNIFYATNGLSALNGLHHSGKIKCSALYEKGSSRNFIDQYEGYVFFGSSSFNINNWCLNASDQKVSTYLWSSPFSGKPYDLQTITYPDGRTKTFTYDYDISSSIFFPGYVPNGKVWGETITGRNSQNTVKTCYFYNTDYQLEQQGVGEAEDCDYKKGFEFLNKYFLKRDYSIINQTTELLNNYYYYDILGRKIGETNSAGISTAYHYDSLNRIVQTDFGCNVTPFPSNDELHAVGSTATIIPTATCEYSRQYEYDLMNNLVGTTFEEKYLVSDTPGISETTSNIYQTTTYDLIGRRF